MNVFFRFIFWAFVFVFIDNSIEQAFSMDTNEDSKRNWVKSLNLNYKEHILDIDKWSLEKKNYINEEDANSIVVENFNEGKLKKNHITTSSYIHNICTGKFFLLCELDSGEVIPYSLDLDTIYISGKVPIKINHKGMVVKSIYSFFTPEQIQNKTINIQAQQAKNINNNILGDNILEDGTCSEASMIADLYLNHLPSMIEGALKNFNEGKLKIVGTIFSVSSTKDSCSERCIPMFNQLMNNMKNLLTKLSQDKGYNTSFSNNLENIVLISSQLPHKKSRQWKQDRDLIISLDLNNPKNRIFSKDIR